MLITVSEDWTDATHVQLTNGWHKAAIYEIVSRPAPFQLLLAKGKIETFPQPSIAGVDTALVSSPLLELENYIGSLALFGDTDTGWGVGGKRINNAFQLGSDMSFCFDTEHALTTAEAAVDSIYVSEALFPGATISLFQSAKVVGNIMPIEDWPTVGSVPDSTVGSWIPLDGDVKIEWAHLSELSHGVSALIQFTTRGTIDMDHTKIDDSTGTNFITIDQGGTDDGKIVDLSWNYVSDNYYRADDGSDGHYIEVDDNDLEDTVIFRDSGGRRFSDDYIYYQNVGTGGVYDSWFTESKVPGLISFVDMQTNQDSDCTVYIERCWAIGMTDQVIQSNGSGVGGFALRDLYTKDNFWSRPNLGWNRVSVNPSVDESATVAGMVVKNMTGYKSERDTLQWTPGLGLEINSDASLINAADTLRVFNGLFRNGGFYQGTKAVDPNSTSAGGVGSTVITDNTTPIIISSCEFRDMSSRGDLTAYTHRSVSGISARGAPGGSWHIRRCLFTGLATTELASIYFDPNNGDVDHFISHCNFQTVSAVQDMNIYFPNGSGELHAWRNVFASEIDRYAIRYNITGPVDIRFNTFVTTTARVAEILLDGAGGFTSIGNIFVNRSSAASVYAWSAATDSASSVIDWNIYRTNRANIGTLGSAITDVNWTNGYDANGSMTLNSGGSLRDTIWREDFARLIAHSDTLSVAHDFISDATVEVDGGVLDDDGSILDAGAMSLLNWKQ